MIADYQSRKMEKTEQWTLFTTWMDLCPCGIVLETFNSEYTVKNRVW